MTSFGGLQLLPAPVTNDIYVAVMGVTGAGKSRFIHECSDLDVKIGDSLASCTADVDDYVFAWHGRNIHLIDTPGFDDTNRSDREVLEDIANWMSTAYQNHVKLSGILFLHRIIDPRVTGTNRRNLIMFKKLCGDDFYPRVFLVGTMWDKVVESVGVARERELKETGAFWGAMVDKGAKIKRHWGTKESATNILISLLEQDRKIKPAAPLQVQKEMVEERKTLDETPAGRQFETELIRQREKHAREIKQMQEDIALLLEANERKAAMEAEEERRVLQEKIDRANMDQASLKKSLEELQNQSKDEVARLIAQVEEERSRYQEKIGRLENAEKQLEHMDPTSPAAQALKDQINQDATDAAAMEKDIAKKNKNIANRLKRGFIKAKGWVEENPNFVKSIIRGLEFVAILKEAGNAGGGGAWNV